MDLLFNNYENQVWQNSENESWNKSIINYSNSLLKKDDKYLSNYFNEWFVHAPMFGHETSNSFLNPRLEYDLDGYNSSLEVVKKAKQRLAILDKVNIANLKHEGYKEFEYQQGFEKFLISFFNNQHNAEGAFKSIQKGNKKEALKFVQNLNPLESLGIYAKTINKYGATKGEEGILVSMNLRWLPDLINLKQKVGVEPIRINFQPTSHDPLAQGPGRNTFFIDEQKNIWLSFGEEELGIPAETSGILPLKKVTDSWINISKVTDIPLRNIRNNNIGAFNYGIELFFESSSANCDILIIEDKKVIEVITNDRALKTVKGNFKTKGKPVFIRIIPKENRNIKLSGIEITPN